MSPYWKSEPEPDADADFLRAAEDEFPHGAEGTEISRRDFLKAAGFAVAGLTVAGCSRAPVQQALPYANQPDGVTPGRPLYYASTCAGCTAGCGLLIKSRDGRPIKLEGNPEHPLSRGGLCAIGQASLLGLYDSLRFRRPLKDGQPAGWDEVDRDIKTRLDEVRRAGGKVRILSNTITSPTTQWLIQEFLGQFADGRHVVYDPLSAAAILDAHQRTHGVRELPRFRLERAEVIVGLDADFLGTWISPVEFTAAYRAGRSLSGDPPCCSLHVRCESRLSLTGSKADQRYRIAPDEIGLILTHLAVSLSARAGAPWTAPGLPPAPIPAADLERLAERLWDKRRRSIVLCGSHDVAVQALCNFVNHLLESYGTTIDLERPSRQYRGNDGELRRLLDELGAGQVAALFLLDCNPIYDLPDQDLASALGRVPLVVACAERANETTQVAKYVCPHPHFLASWNDAEPVSGVVSLTQPTFPTMGEERPIVESLAAWMPTQRPATALAIVQQYWRDRVFPRQTRAASFQDFWDRALHDGYAEIEPQRVTPRPFNRDAVQPVVPAQRADNSFSLVLYPTIGLGDGRHAYNPWLQELPDPITKLTWDNYVCLSPATAARLQVHGGDVVRLESEGVSLELPALLQPGQHDGTVAVPLGYGSVLSARFANIGPRWLEAGPTVGENGLVGANAASLLTFRAGSRQYEGRTVRVTKTGRHHPLASTQGHHTIVRPANMLPDGRQPLPIIQETTVDTLAHPEPHGHAAAHADLWPADHDTPRHRWAMVIDLNACTGCSACILACQAENNIPVVGKDEVRRQREMHWLRIDRYYAERGGDVDVAFQPMMCQHCGNAPCETVCPVLATVHSSEGLNQQVYNRCVGTRYCANNCPYKVRRFNWFNYPREDVVQNLVLNPDVTVRSRGVMEKCSFCVQRIQEAKIATRHEGGLTDGIVQTACQQSCPAQAIVFGDLNDPASRVARAQHDPRRYQVLAELNVRPSVSYLSVVRNRAEGAGHG